MNGNNLNKIIKKLIKRVLQSPHRELDLRSPSKRGLGLRSPSRRAGFTVIFAVLVASLLVIIGTSILNISIKELRISSSSRESQKAFYASDGAIECAFYWDFVKLAFSTSTPLQTFRCASYDVRTSDSISYGLGQTLNIDLQSDTRAVTTFILDSDEKTADYCATVEVVKEEISEEIQTTITARGYNTCDLDNLRRVERAVRVVY